MSEKIKFTPEVVSEYQQKLEKIKEQDGFMLERDEENERSIISFLGAKEGVGGELKERIVEFASEIDNEEEMREILEGIKQTPLFRKIFTFIAESYNEQRIPLIQSVPGTGKTFAYEKFNELLHGKGADKEYIACTPKTSELDIIGHWAPAGGKESSKEYIKQRLSENEKWEKFKEAWERKLENLFAQKGALEEEKFQEEFGKLSEEYAEFQREALNIDKEESSDWTYHRGALLASYKNPKDAKDEGRFGIIDEIDNLPENYQNIFLQISGERAKLTDRITAYSNSGTTKYQKGKNTFIAFAANYPELATGKRAISAPLADRVDWLSITPEESLEDERLRIEEYSFSDLSEQFKEADPKIVENMRSVLGRSLALLHTQWKTALADYRKEGIEMAGGRTRGREQEKEFSQRTAVGFEDAVMGNLNNPAYLNSETGRIDMSEIFYDAFQTKYLNFLASGKLRIRFQKEQLLPLLYGGRKQLLESDKGIDIKEMPELQESAFLYVEDNGVFRPYDSEKDQNKEKFAMDQVLDILVEKLSVTEKNANEEIPREDVEKEKIKEEMRELADFQDSLEKDLENMEKDIDDFCEFEKK